MRPPDLIGTGVLLRAPKVSDKADRMAAGRDPEARRMYGGDMRVEAGPITVEEVGSWYEKAASDAPIWVIEFEGRCVGGLGLHSIDNENRRARFAIGIFDRTVWDRGVGTEATRLLLGYGFDVLDLHRIDLRVLSFNLRAIRCYEKCGFVREGIEREGAWISGQWESDVLMSILDDEYRAMMREVE